MAAKIGEVMEVENPVVGHRIVRGFMRVKSIFRYNKTTSHWVLGSKEMIAKILDQC